jgi:hypothetical protein
MLAPGEHAYEGILFIAIPKVPGMSRASLYRADAGRVAQRRSKLARPVVSILRMTWMIP